MFDMVAFDKEINNLLRSGKKDVAEKYLLKTHSELRYTAAVQDLEYVCSRLAHFYSAPGSEDLEKAEAYFRESEALLPGAETKCQTALFYLYVARDATQTVKKIDEITAADMAAAPATYYSALALKGQACIALNMVDEAGEILEELLSRARAARSNLPYGDEINLLQAAITHPILENKCRELLELIIPRIRSEEYVGKAKLLLDSRRTD
jgi:hypothetical protein